MRFILAVLQAISYAQNNVRNNITWIVFWFAIIDNKYALCDLITIDTRSEQKR